MRIDTTTTVTVGPVRKVAVYEPEGSPPPEQRTQVAVWPDGDGEPLFIYGESREAIAEFLRGIADRVAADERVGA